MKKETIAAIHSSIAKGYLSTDWHQEKDSLVETHDGYFALEEDCVEISNEYYHTVIDDENGNIVYTFNDEWELAENCVYCVGNNRRTYYMLTYRCVRYGGEWYDRDYLSDNDLYYTVDTDKLMYREDAYYYEGDYYEYEQFDDDDDDDDDDDCLPANSLFSYNSGVLEKNFVTTDAQEGITNFGFGIEIEKNEMPSFSFDKTEIHDIHGAVIEKDASVPDGFELKTPIYNLMSPKTDERIQFLKPYADIRNVSNAGGHIGFSIEGMRPNDMLRAVSGWLPLIYAMHKARLTNTYCTGKTVKNLIRDGEKMQSVRVRDEGYIEFRIFSSIKSFETILFRLELFRLMANNLKRTPYAIIGMAIDKKSKLNALLRKKGFYEKDEKFDRLIQDSIDICRNLGNAPITPKRVDKIIFKLKNKGV